MSAWRDKTGITHAWLPLSDQRRDNRHAGWYTARAPCGASRRLRSCWDDKDRPRSADVDCMTCLVRQESDNT